MRQGRHTFMSRAKALAAALVLVVLVSTTTYTVFKPKPAQAQCVCGMLCTLAGGGIGQAINTIMTAQVVVEILNTYSSLSTLYDALTQGFNGVITNSLQVADDNLNQFMDDFVAYDLIPAMKEWTAQFNTLQISHNTQFNAMIDGRNQTKVLGALDDLEAKSFIEARANPNVCVGATFSGGLVRGRTFRDKFGPAFSNRIMGLDGNVLSQTVINALQNAQITDLRNVNIFPGLDYYRAQTGGFGGQYCSEYHIEIDEDDYLSAAAGGSALYQLARFNNYYNLYCDPAANGGSGCPNGPGAYKNKDVLVQETLLDKDTIDFTVEEELQAVTDLVINLCQPEVPDVIPPSSFSNPSTQEEILGRRSFRARRQVCKKLIVDVAARRVPGTRVGAYRETLGKAAGVKLEDLSENPSLHEIMNVLAGERFWTGTYNLGNVDGPAQVDHEKLTLQAAELMLIGDYYDMMNSLSMMLASQVANEIIELGDPASGR